MRLLNIEISTGSLSLPYLITRQTHTIKIGHPLKAGQVFFVIPYSASGGTGSAKNLVSTALTP